MNDFINIVLCHQQTFQQMGTLHGLFEIISGTAHNDLFLEFQILIQHMPQGEDLWLLLIIHQRQHIHRKGRLHGSIGKQRIEYHLSIGISLQLDDHAHAFPVRLIPQIRDALDTLILYLIGNGTD